MPPKTHRRARRTTQAGGIGGSSLGPESPATSPGGFGGAMPDPGVEALTSAPSGTDARTSPPAVHRRRGGPMPVFIDEAAAAEPPLLPSSAKQVAANSRPDPQLSRRRVGGPLSAPPEDVAEHRPDEALNTASASSSSRSDESSSSMESITSANCPLIPSGASPASSPRAVPLTVPMTDPAALPTKDTALPTEDTSAMDIEYFLKADPARQPRVAVAAHPVSPPRLVPRPKPPPPKMTTVKVPVALANAAAASAASSPRAASMTSSMRGRANNATVPETPAVGDVHRHDGPATAAPQVRDDGPEEQHAAATVPVCVPLPPPVGSGRRRSDFIQGPTPKQNGRLVRSRVPVPPPPPPQAGGPNRREDGARLGQTAMPNGQEEVNWEPVPATASGSDALALPAADVDACTDNDDETALLSRPAGAPASPVGAASGEDVAKLVTAAVKAGDIAALTHAMAQAAAVLRDATRRYPSQAEQLESAAASLTRWSQQERDSVNAAVAQRKRDLRRDVGTRRTAAVIKRIESLRAEAEEASATVHAEQSWKSKAAELLQRNLEGMKERAAAADDQTGAEHEELALLQQQTTALFEKQSQTALDTAELESTNAHIMRLLNLSHSLSDRKATLADQLAMQREKFAPTVRDLHEQGLDLERTARQYRAKAQVVRRRLSDQEAVNGTLQQELSRIAAANDVATGELEDLKTAYELREARALRSWTPRPSHAAVESAGVVAGKSTSAVTEAAVKKLAAAVTSAKRNCDELAKLGRVAAPLMDLGVAGNTPAPPVSWRVGSSRGDGGSGGLGGDEDDDDDDDDDEFDATTAATSAASSPTARGLGTPSSGGGSFHVSRNPPSRRNLAGSQAQASLTLPRSKGPPIPSIAADTPGVPRMLCALPAVSRPRWRLAVAESHVVSLLKATAQVASGSYLSSIAPKGGFPTASESMAFKVSEVLQKAAGQSTLAAEVTAIFEADGLEHFAKTQSTQASMAARLAVFRLVLACEHFAPRSDLCRAFLRVCAGTLPLTVAEAPLAAVSRIVSQTHGEGGGMANIKSVYLSITREFAPYLGAAEIIRLRAAALLDAATTGAGPTASLKLTALTDTATTLTTKQLSNAATNTANTGLLLRASLREHIRMVDAAHGALEAAVRPLVVNSLGAPGVLLVSLARVKSAWERVRFDANTLAAAESGIRIASEQLWVTLNVKATYEAVTQDLRTEDAVLHGLRAPAPVASAGQSPRGRDLTPSKSTSSPAGLSSLDRSARRTGGAKKTIAPGPGIGRRQTSVGSIGSPAGSGVAATAGASEDPHLADLVDAAQLLSVLRFAPVKFVTT